MNEQQPLEHFCLNISHIFLVKVINYKGLTYERREGEEH